ncbi:hypothetical protein FHS15_005653 [Paenibacillus castaneae]|nr:hypothetical protein [Paenibacillus castaneae]
MRHFLYLMTMSMVMTNPEIRASHRYNVEEKKRKEMKFIMKLCGKVVRMLIALAKNNTSYEPIKVFTQAA